MGYDLIDWWRYHYIPCYGALENCFMNLMSFESLSNIYIPWWKLSTLPEKAFMQNPDLHVHVFRRSKKLIKLHTWNVSFTVWLTHVPWCRIRRQWMGSAMVQIMACRLFEKKSNFFIQENSFQIVICEMATILSTGRWVNCLRQVTVHLPCRRPCGGLLDNWIGEVCIRNCNPITSRSLTRWPRNTVPPH